MKDISPASGTDSCRRATEDLMAARIFSLSSPARTGAAPAPAANIAPDTSDTAAVQPANLIASLPALPPEEYGDWPAWRIPLSHLLDEPASAAERSGLPTLATACSVALI